MPRSTRTLQLAGLLSFLVMIGCETADSMGFNDGEDSELEERVATTGPTSNNLIPNGQLATSQYLQSADGSYRLVLQGDGNLVLKRISDSRTFWASATAGKSAARFVFQADGNLVLKTNAGAVVWRSATAGSGATKFFLHNNGALILYKNSTVVWSVNNSSPSDQCPDDPNKTVPGLCGCGVPEGSCGGNPNPWKFVVVGDSRGDNNGVNTSVLSHLVKAIIAEKAEFVLFPGDLTTNGTSSQLSTWINTVKPLYDANIRVYAVRGNHDASLSAWNNAFSGNYRLPQNGPTNEKNLTYSVVYKNVFFAGIENYSSASGINQSWLNTQLAANTQPHVFVFGHLPAFSADHSDTLDDNVSVRNTFWQSIKNAGARAYFCGHDHFYSHARIGDGGNTSDDLHQFIIGTAGAPLYNFNGRYQGSNGNYTPAQQHFEMQYGYIVVLVDGQNVELTFKKRSSSSYVQADRLNYTAQ